MTVITRITTQKKQTGRFNVYVDRGRGEEFGFVVSEDVLVAFALAKGKEIDEKELQNILFEEEVKKAFNAAVHILSFRMRSVKEIQDYLRKKDASPEVIENVLQRLTRLEYANDTEFAKSFVRSRKRTSSKGPGAIRQELRVKGVADADISEALEEYSFDEQVQAVSAFAAKRVKQNQQKSNSEMKQSILQTLMGKGFSREVIETALRQTALEKSEEEEWQALVAQAEKAHRKYRKYEGWEYERRMKQSLYRKGFPISLIDRYLERRE